jgi:hypothetical protein
MPRRWVMVVLFLSSYSPLFVLVGLRSLDQSHAIAIACGALAVLGWLGTWLFLSTAKRKPRERYEVVEIEKRDGDVAAYAATYLLPFVTVFGGDWQDVLSLTAFIAFLGAIYVRSRLIYVNPVLALFGYHLWQVIAVTAGAEESSKLRRWPRYLLARRSEVYREQRLDAYTVLDDLLLDAEEPVN